MNLNEVIAHLKQHPKLYSEVKNFSDSPDIYAFFSRATDNTESFPFESEELIYIGKTESSQQKRDANTHFKSGKTGSSTVRRSIGAILIQELNLKPVPRNQSDFKKGRTSAYKFDDASEERLTEWIRKHISMTFFEFQGIKEELNSLETAIISKLVPPLNISKNPGNPFKTDLQKLRKNCAAIAHSGNNNHTTESDITHRKVKTTLKNRTGKNTGKYSNFWLSQLSAIREKLKTSHSPQQIQLDKRAFEQLGNRKRYAFNLEFSGIEVANNIGGSAVARDLAGVLKDDPEMRKILMGSRFKINMDSDFVLWVQRI